MTNDKQKNRLVELLEEARTEEKRLALFGDTDTQIDMPRGDEFTASYLLENGVIVPPVKYGDTLYIITEVSKTIIETIVLGVWIYEESFTVLTIHGNILSDSFGKTVFLTKKEAANALGGVQG